MAMRGVKRIAKLVISLACWPAARGIGLVRDRLSGTGRSVCVALYYHGITDAQRPRFRRQMEWLKSHTEVVPVAQARSGSGSDRRVCITFDDAFESVRRNAVPILEELALPATIFAVSGNLGRQPEWEMEPDCPDREECVMSAEQLLELPGELIEVGSHTVSHRSLVTLSTEELRRELTDSKHQLEDILSKPVDSLSVPFGEWTKRTVQAAREVGYRTVLTCEPEVIRPSDNTFHFGRFEVSPDDWMVEFILKAGGAHRWRRHVRRVKRTFGAFNGGTDRACPCGEQHGTRGKVEVN